MKQWTEEELINDGNRLRNAESLTRLKRSDTGWIIEKTLMWTTEKFLQ